MLPSCVDHHRTVLKCSPLRCILCRIGTSLSRLSKQLQKFKCCVCTNHIEFLNKKKQEKKEIMSKSLLPLSKRHMHIFIKSIHLWKSVNGLHKLRTLNCKYVKNRRTKEKRPKHCQHLITCTSIKIKLLHLFFVY